jgi:hypothetical protein
LQGSNYPTCSRRIIYCDICHSTCGASGSEDSEPDDWFRLPWAWIWQSRPSEMGHLIFCASLNRIHAAVVRLKPQFVSSFLFDVIFWSRKYLIRNHKGWSRSHILLALLPKAVRDPRLLWPGPPVICSEGIARSPSKYRFCRKAGIWRSLASIQLVTDLPLCTSRTQESWPRSHLPLAPPSQGGEPARGLPPSKGGEGQGYSVFSLEVSERRLSSRRRIETKRAGLAECAAWLRYGSLRSLS